MATEQPVSKRAGRIHVRERVSIVDLARVEADAIRPHTVQALTTSLCPDAPGLSQMASQWSKGI
jgi:hypothetical protein